MSRAFITVYLTRPKMDRHPVNEFPVDFDMLQRLAESVMPHGELIVIADELRPHHVPANLRDTVTIHRVRRPVANVYFERWDFVRDVLTKRPDLEWVYVADGRDVVVVRDPWDYLEPATLYTCTEPARLKRRWRGQPLGVSGFINDIGYHCSPVIQEWIRANPHLVALNAGVSAGDRDTMLGFATRMADGRREEHVAGDYTDMALFNWIAHREFHTIGSERYIGAKCHLQSDAPKARVLHVP